MRLFIVIQFCIEGYHKHGSPAGSCASIHEAPHRHVFHFRAEQWIDEPGTVDHLHLKRSLQRHAEGVFGIGPSADECSVLRCEEMARMLAETFKLDCVVVLEDGENGGGAVNVKGKASPE